MAIAEMFGLSSDGNSDFSYYFRMELTYESCVFLLNAIRVNETRVFTSVKF